MSNFPHPSSKPKRGESTLSTKLSEFLHEPLPPSNALPKTNYQAVATGLPTTNAAVVNLNRTTDDNRPLKKSSEASRSTNSSNSKASRRNPLIRKITSKMNEDLPVGRVNRKPSNSRVDKVSAFGKPNSKLSVDLDGFLSGETELLARKVSSQRKRKPKQQITSTDIDRMLSSSQDLKPKAAPTRSNTAHRARGVPKKGNRTLPPVRAVHQKKQMVNKKHHQHLISRFRKGLSFISDINKYKTKEVRDAMPVNKVVVKEVAINFQSGNMLTQGTQNSREQISAAVISVDSDSQVSKDRRKRSRFGSKHVYSKKSSLDSAFDHAKQSGQRGVYDEKDERDQPPPQNENKRFVIVLLSTLGLIILLIILSRIGLF